MKNPPGRIFGPADFFSYFEDGDLIMLHNTLAATVAFIRFGFRRGVRRLLRRT
jgi:hypothetical protein